MSLYSSEDLRQEADIKRHELEAAGVRGYLADVEVAKHVNALKRRNSRDRLIPTDLPDVPVEIEIDPAISLGLTDVEADVCGQVADYGFSGVSSVSQATARRIVFRVAARLVMSGTVVQSKGSSSGSGEESGGSIGLEDMNVDLFRSN